MAMIAATQARRPLSSRLPPPRHPPRSRHLPLASTEGSLTRNLNEIGVRLWTDCSLDEDAEISGARRSDPGRCVCGQLPSHHPASTDIREVGANQGGCHAPIDQIARHSRGARHRGLGSFRNAGFTCPPRSRTTNQCGSSRYPAGYRLHASAIRSYLKSSGVWAP